MKKYRTIVIGTGNIATEAVRCLFDRVDIDLIGVWAHPDTAGHLIDTDAGLLFCDEEIGLKITGDLDVLLATKPDCAVFTVNILNVNEVLVPLMVKVLEAGVNIVGTSNAKFFYPPGNVDQSAIRILEDACQKGNATFLTTGIEPGFANDDLVCKLLSGSNSVKKITATEYMDYSPYPDLATLQIMGFGLPIDYPCRLDNAMVLQASWGPGVTYIADAMGYKVDEFRCTYDRALLDRDVQTAVGVMEKGTVGAVRAVVTGVINGEERVTLSHVNRVDPKCAPDWGTVDRDGCYELKVEGDPNFTCHFMIGDEPSYINYESIIFTSCRAINAIPYVCEAEPGCTSTLELPNTYPKYNVFRSNKSVPTPKKYGKPGTEN